MFCFVFQKRIIHYDFSWWFSGIFQNNNNNNNLHLTTNGKKCEKNIVILQIKYSWWRYFTSKFYISHFTFHKRIIFKFFFLVLKQKQNKHGEHMQHIVSLSTIFHHHFVQTNSIICFICVKEENLHVMFFLQKSKSNQKMLNEKKYNWILSAKKREIFRKRENRVLGYSLEHFWKPKLWWRREEWIVISRCDHFLSIMIRYR